MRLSFKGPKFESTCARQILADLGIHPLHGVPLVRLGQGATCHVFQVHLQVVLVGPMAAIVGNDVRMPQWYSASGTMWYFKASASYC